MVIILTNNDTINHYINILDMFSTVLDLLWESAAENKIGFNETSNRCLKMKCRIYSRMEKKAT